MSLVDESLTKFRGLLEICNKDRDPVNNFKTLGGINHGSKGSD